MQGTPAYFRVLLGPVTAVALSFSFAGSALAQVAPALERSAARLGQQRPSAPVSGTVWLQLHNKAALDAAVAAMYTPGSPTFHTFLKRQDLQQYAPSASEIASVRKELEAHNLTVVSTDAQNYSVKFQGLTSDFESAFHTTVNQYRKQDGTMVSAPATAPTLQNGASGLVRAVTGIASSGLKSEIKHPVNPLTGKQKGLVRAAGIEKPQGVFYSGQCFFQPQTIQLTTNNPQGTGLPSASYTGIVYGAPVTNTQPGTVNPCGYSPQNIYSFYGLNVAYQQGYTGQGQTIAIVDAYGSPTIQSDLATFDSIYGLEPLTSQSFQVVQTAPFNASNQGDAEETTLDVEWSHAIAPGANILLVTTPSASDDDLQAGLMYIVERDLANTISDSYGSGEAVTDPQSLLVWDEICEMAAAEGISVNVASGDEGDSAAVENGKTDVNSPADSPYATAVGGTSLASSPYDGTTLQTGWGTNEAVLSVAQNGTKVVLSPPLLAGFQGGSGGGVSKVFAAPAYQSTLNLAGRGVPDVAAIADPNTPVELVFTVGGVQYFELVGGTSLAAPVFSGEWALLNQRFGFALGQAAPYIGQAAGSRALDDMVFPPEAGLVTGSVTNTAGTTPYSADTLGQNEPNIPFDSAYASDGTGNVVLYTFGTDSSLHLATGWDPVTGWGTLDMGNIFTATANVK